MLDLQFIIQNQELVKQALANRQKKQDIVDELVKTNDQRKNILVKVEDLRHQQNQLSRSVTGKPTEEQIKQGSEIKKQLKKIESELTEIEKNLNLKLEEIPNIPADDVPIGKDDSDNQIYKKSEEPPHLDFSPKDHLDIGEKLDILDVKKASEISGSRFGYFKGKGAVLEMAVMFYAFNKLIEKGFIGMVPPAMIKSKTEWGCGYSSNKNLFNAFYSVPEDDLIFISSSEHSVIPYHSNEVLSSKSLPIKYVNYSPCFRRESGTYGKDTKGMFRVHFFNKVEMNIWTLPDYKISDDMCLEMLSIEEEIMKELGIPYQIMKCCSGDLPQPNRRMYDINAWWPSLGQYKETHSCSNCGDYQSRRLNTKTKIDGKNQFVHILNATVITDRVVLAIIENHQQSDGSINIPKCLWNYTNFQKIEP